MQKQNQTDSNKQLRKGDTGRSSSQGRKLSSGGTPDKKGDPEIDELSKTPKTELKKANPGKS